MRLLQAKGNKSFFALAFAFISSSLFICHVAFAEVLSNVDEIFIFQARKAIEGGNPEEALRHLSHVAVSERDQQLVSVGMQALRDIAQKITHNEIDARRSRILKTPEVMDFVAYLETASATHNDFAALYRHMTLFCANQEEQYCARTYYQKVCTLGGGEDLIPFKKLLALEVAGSSHDDFAQELVRDIEKEGRATLFFKVQLFLSGFYGFWQVFLVGLLLVSCISFGVFLLTMRVDIPRFLPEKKTRPGKGYLRKIDKDEYSILLASLNLTDTATEEEIKNRYRELVKIYHPDSGVPLEENIEKFRELKKTYERILEFKKRSFSGR